MGKLAKAPKKRKRKQDAKTQWKKYERHRKNGKRDRHRKNGKGIRCSVAKARSKQKDIAKQLSDILVKRPCDRTASQELASLQYKYDALSQDHEALTTKYEDTLSQNQSLRNQIVDLNRSHAAEAQRRLNNVLSSPSKWGGAFK